MSKKVLHKVYRRRRRHHQRQQMPRDGKNPYDPLDVGPIFTPLNISKFTKYVCMLQKENFMRNTQKQNKNWLKNNTLFGILGSLFYVMVYWKRSIFTEVHTMKILPILVPFVSLDSENIEMGKITNDQKTRLGMQSNDNTLPDLLCHMS